MTDPVDPTPADAPSSRPSVAADMRPRPLIERIGLAAIALVLGAIFAIVGVAAFVGGDPFLGVMGGIGTVMVLWVGGLALFRG
jgi:hypothetical protein